MIHDVVSRLSSLLAATPSPLLSSARIGPVRPSRTADLPAVAISVDVDRAEELGWGRLVRGSQQLPLDRMREDLRGDRMAGVVGFEVWAAGATEAARLSRDLDAKLRGGRAALREGGFVAMRPAALEPAESLRQDGGNGAAFSAWRQRVAYRFVYEGIEGGELTDAGLIRRIDVDVEELDNESFSTPAEP